jgi:hypothetical protein
VINHDQRKKDELTAVTDICAVSTEPTRISVTVTGTMSDPAITLACDECGRKKGQAIVRRHEPGHDRNWRGVKITDWVWRVNCLGCAVLEREDCDEILRMVQTANAIAPIPSTLAQVLL